jgi:predicted transcriptional regulator
LCDVAEIGCAADSISGNLAAMSLTFPSVEDVRAQLAPLSMKQLERLEQLSGVPAPTIYKIKLGDTKNPGVETLRKFVQHIKAASKYDPGTEANTATKRA